MKFHIQNLYIWLKNGKRREISFLPNKVNIITGDSLTGKTAILDIIDYCLFCSQHTISEASINERAEWYGIRFAIQDKTYTIARQAPDEGMVSANYYFSSIGEVPDDIPETTNTDAALKKLLGADFGIDQDAKVSFGGNMIKAGSRVSLRYFLLFNTISQDIITHTSEFFDKQSDRRYREALPRTFDLAVGIDTVSNILKREKRVELEKRVKRLEKELEATSKKKELFHEQLEQITQRAKEFGFIDESETTESSISQLSDMVANYNLHEKESATNLYDQLSSQLSKINLKIRNLKRFSSEYSRYKKSLQTTSDSLRPVSFLLNDHETLVRTSIFEEIIEALRSDHDEIKKAISKKAPMDGNISDLLKDLENQRSVIKGQLGNLPRNPESLELERDKHFFLGETKAKLDLYANQSNEEKQSPSEKISELEAQISLLNVQPIEERRDLFISVMNETTQSYLEKAADALGDYANYKTFFDYKDKRLQLKKPMSLSIENVGSSSNHMFLHLFMFLGLHKVIQANQVPHVAPFLVIDQFSRPYWGEKGNEKDELASSDVKKVKIALKLLDGFVDEMKPKGNGFQMIVFEHIPQSYWAGLNNIHLVEEFVEGNALIPEEYADD